MALRVDFTVPLARLYSSQKENGEKDIVILGRFIVKKKDIKEEAVNFFRQVLNCLEKQVLQEI